LLPDLIAEDSGSQFGICIAQLLKANLALSRKQLVFLGNNRQSLLSNSVLNPSPDVGN
jgi:hypothetical protein